MLTFTAFHHMNSCPLGIQRILQGLNNIKWLRLSHNSLNNLAHEAFAGLFTLSRLSLDHNELQFFPTQAMSR